MKTILILLILLLTAFFSLGQNLRLTDIWYFQKSDYNKDSLKKNLLTNCIYLKYDEVVNLQFSSIDSVKKYAIYQYRIANSENFGQWIEIGNQAIMQLHSLDDGKHTLVITAKDNPKKTLSTTSIYVKQVLWQETWFWVVLGIYFLFLVGLGIYFLTLYNLRQKLKLQDIRNNIASDLHDEVGSNLNSIAIFVELLRKKSPPELLPILDKITNNSVESVQLMQDTIWAIQSKNDSFQKFIDRIRGFTTEILAAKSISLVFDNQVISPKTTLRMETRKNAYMIFKEAVNNIAKHSKASKVSVQITSSNNMICIEIIDNGIGFDANQVSAGNGLNNFEERAVNSDMKLRIVSSIGNGTKVLLEIPVE